MSRLDINIDRHHSHAIEKVNLNTLNELAPHGQKIRSLQTTARALSVDNHGLLSRRTLLRLLSQARTDNLFSSQHEDGTLKGKLSTNGLGSWLPNLPHRHWVLSLASCSSSHPCLVLKLIIGTTSSVQVYTLGITPSKRHPRGYGSGCGKSFRI